MTYAAARFAEGHVFVLVNSVLRRRLARRFRNEGIDVDKFNTVFVEFAPSDRPRTYDKWSNWDVGFLFLFSDRLVYLGDHTRFAVGRKQIQRQCLGPSSHDPTHPPNLYVSWGNPQSNRSSVFGLGVGEGRSLARQRHNTPVFAERFDRWWRDAGSSDQERNPNWPPFSLPYTVNETGVSIRSANPPLLLLIGGLANAWLTGGAAWVAGRVLQVPVELHLPFVCAGIIPPIAFLWREAYYVLRFREDI
jgi:hypothetical protein